jgi:hypothetical protein
MQMTQAACACGRCSHGGAAQAGKAAPCPAQPLLPVYAAEPPGAELQQLQPGTTYLVRVQVSAAQRRRQHMGCPPALRQPLHAGHGLHGLQQSP